MSASHGFFRGPSGVVCAVAAIAAAIAWPLAAALFAVTDASSIFECAAGHLHALASIWAATVCPSDHCVRAPLSAAAAVWQL